MSTFYLDQTSDTPLTKQLAKILRAQIQSGKLAPGAKLPSESELRNEFGLSRTTVRDALQKLALEGLVTAKKGYGTFVKEQKIIRRVSAPYAGLGSSTIPVLETIAQLHGMQASRKIMKVAKDTLPTDIAILIDPTPDLNIIVRKRLQFLNDSPAIISTSYYPLWLAENNRLSKSAPVLPEGPDNFISSLGYETDTWEEILRARIPTVEEAQLLAIDQSTPVIRTIRIMYGKDYGYLQIADDLYPSDGFEFLISSSNSRKHNE